MRELGCLQGTWVQQTPIDLKLPALWAYGKLSYSRVHGALRLRADKSGKGSWNFWIADLALTHEDQRLEFSHRFVS